MTMKEKRAAIYVRVSTSEQDTALQETELRQYAESRGWDCVVYQDKAQSGAKNDRPALNQMLSDMRRRKFDVMVVWKLDRLARSLKQLLTIGEECRSLGVDLVSLRQNIDTTLPAGRLTFQILGAVAEFERDTKLMFASRTDQWETPMEFFAGLSKQFDFRLDVCADAKTAKCDFYYDEEIDAL
jgi:DNA invertase Pin-like site-specific DNA recombinase